MRCATFTRASFFLFLRSLRRRLSSSFFFLFFVFLFSLDSCQEEKWERFLYCMLSFTNLSPLSLLPFLVCLSFPLSLLPFLSILFCLFFLSSVSQLTENVRAKITCTNRFNFGSFCLTSLFPVPLYFLFLLFFLLLDILSFSLHSFFIHLWYIFFTRRKRKKKIILPLSLYFESFRCKWLKLELMKSFLSPLFCLSFHSRLNNRLKIDFVSILVQEKLKKEEEIQHQKSQEYKIG